MKSNLLTVIPWCWRKYKDIENEDAFIVETAEEDPFVICQVCPWKYDDIEIVNNDFGSHRAGLIASAPHMLKTLKWIHDQQHLFFAECEQAENISTEVRKAISIATTPAMTYSGVPFSSRPKRIKP